MSRVLKSVKKLPSRRQMLDIIKGVRRDHMLPRCSRMATSSMLQARRRGMLRHPIDVAIDERDMPSHARVMNMAYVVCSRYKKGAKKTPPAGHPPLDGGGAPPHPGRRGGTPGR